MSQQKKKRRSYWAHRPDLPLKTSPLFEAPFSPGNIFLWFVKSWLPVSETLIVFILAGVSWYFFHPDLSETKSFEAGWISLIFIRNFCLMIFVAGGLHLYFFTLKKQSNRFRYDDRPMQTGNRAFTFNNQVYDNIFWTCASGVPIWTAYEVLIMWAMANEYIAVMQWQDNPVWFVALFLIMPMWESTYFFIVHRWLHWPPLYKLAHYLHHRNTNIGPWSGMSMHPIEHVLYLGTALAHFLIVSHPLHVIFHLQYYTLTAATTHTGFQGLFVRGKNLLPLGTFHHQMHHRYLDCNYGGLDVPLDKWTDSFHDGTEESHAAFLKRRAVLLSERSA